MAKNKDTEPQGQDTPPGMVRVIKVITPGGKTVVETFVPTKKKGRPTRRGRP